MSKEYTKDPYGTGYGKPPIANRFKKGQSGNPKGRPVGAQNKTATEAAKLVDLVRGEAAREIVTGPEGEYIGIQQALVRSILVNGVKGKAYAQRHSIDLIRYAEKDMDEQKNKEKVYPFEQLIEGVGLQAKLTELEMACKQYGKPYPSILPKPNDIILDFERGDVIFRFPFGETELKIWKGFWGQKHCIAKEQAELAELLRNDTLSRKQRDELEGLLEAHEKIFEMICNGMWEKWRIEPEDMSGEACDLDEFMEGVIIDDPVVEKFVAMAGYIVSLCDMRRAIVSGGGQCH